MTRHSKNNSSLHHFTHAERTRLDYGTKKQRLGKDSLRSFYDCYLCLQRARDPMCCAKGHVSCRECVLESILAQTKEVDRQKKALAAQQDRLAKEDAERAELEQQRQVEQFARAQSLLSRESNSGASSKKRKLDDPEEKETKTLKVAGAVAGSGDKPALPSFWLPSLTPEAKPDILKTVQTDILCTASDPHHAITMKKLTSVKFNVVDDKSAEGNVEPSYSCPSCTKSFTNGSKISIILSCGHVLCKSCMDQFVKGSGSCFVCSKKCADKDIIRLASSEGTGFASVGQAEAKKEGLGFQ